MLVLLSIRVVSDPLSFHGVNVSTILFYFCCRLHILTPTLGYNTGLILCVTESEADSFPKDPLAEDVIKFKVLWAAVNLNL